MICNLRPDQAERVLCEQTYSTPDDKVMNRTWIRNFIVVGLFLIASAVLVTLHPNDNKCWFILSGALAVVVIVTSKFVKARVIGPKKFKASIEMTSTRARSCAMSMRWTSRSTAAGTARILWPSRRSTSMSSLPP